MPSAGGPRAIEFKCPFTNKARVLGLVDSSFVPAAIMAASFTQIKYGIACNANGNAYVFEGGSMASWIGSYTANTFRTCND